MLDAGVKKRSLIVVLLSFFMATNFADKAVIGLAGPDIMTSLHISPSSFGLIGSGFFLLFSFSGLFVGFLANRVKAYYIILVLSLIWALAQLPIVVAGSFWVILVSRIILGAGEGPAFPLAMHAVFKWFPDGKRNMPTIFVQQGVNLGLTLSGPILTFFIVSFGWKSAFLFLAVVGMLWTILWAFVGGDGKEAPIQLREDQATQGDQEKLPAQLLFGNATFIAITIIYFAEYAALAVYFTWLPAYLQKGLGFSRVETGWIFSAIAAIGIPATFLMGDISNRLRKAGYSSRVARGLMLSITPILGGICFILLLFPFHPMVKVVLLGLGRVFTQTIFSFGPLVLAEICPKDQRSGVLGTMSFVGTIGGIISPYVMGILVQHVGGMSRAGFEAGYIDTGIVVVIAGLIGVFLVNPEKTMRCFKERF